MKWRHVVISTRSSWLPGSPRGWRSRNHKRHSSGDYKKPPPPDEHEGLREYVEKRAQVRRGKVRLVQESRPSRETLDYILYEQGAGAFTWSLKDQTLMFIPNRKRPAGHRRTRARVV